MNRVALITALAVSLAVPASAQWDTHWNDSGPHPDSCVFNSATFYPGDNICVRPNVSQACEPDGTMADPVTDSSCNAAQSSVPTIIRAQGRHDAACSFGDRTFSVGAEVCSAGGAKIICQATGYFARPVHETTCLAPLQTNDR
jgi:hypothetical protein